MLITAFYIFDPGNEVGSLSPTECLMGIELGVFHFLLQCLNLLFIYMFTYATYTYIQPYIDTHIYTYKYIHTYTHIHTHNSLKFSFTNIQGLHSNFVDCESFIEWNFPDILALCETNLDGSIGSGNFSVRGYLPLIRKDSSTHMHGLAVYMKEGLPFARDLSLENSADSYLCFRLALLHSVSYFFFLYRSPSSSLCTVFDSISSNIDEVLSINQSANVFFLWWL